MNGKRITDEIRQRIVFYWIGGIRNFEELGRVVGLYGSQVRDVLIQAGQYQPKPKKEPKPKVLREPSESTARKRQSRKLRFM